MFVLAETGELCSIRRLCSSTRCVCEMMPNLRTTGTLTTGMVESNCKHNAVSLIFCHAIKHDCYTIYEDDSSSSP